MLFGAVAVISALLCGLLACSGKSSSSDPSEIQPGEPDYPVTNPHPTHVLTIKATIPPTLSVGITALYLASPMAGGTMQSGTSCQKTVGLAVTAPFSLTKAVSFVQHNGTYTAFLPIDGLIPGRCDWDFAELNYSVKGVSDSTEPFRWVLARHAGEGSAVEKLDIWCIRQQIYAGTEQGHSGEYCGSLGELNAEFPGRIPSAFIKPASNPATSRNSSIVIGVDTNTLQITFYDVDGLPHR